MTEANRTEDPVTMPNQVFPDPNNDNQCSCAKGFALSAEVDRLRVANDGLRVALLWISQANSALYGYDSLRLKAQQALSGDSRG